MKLTHKHLFTYRCLFLMVLFPIWIAGCSNDDEEADSMEPWVIGDLADVNDGELEEDFFKVPEIRSKDGKLELDLHVRYGSYRLGTDSVDLRSYWTEQHGIIGPQGPTIRVKPNDRVTVVVHNDLPPEGQDPHLKGTRAGSGRYHPKDHNKPHGFNSTNLHTHGWHVSPYQDDIFRKISPTYASNYTYDLDSHIPGTFWYHPHTHGATALQVGSGMAGALIVDEENFDGHPELEAASSPEHERIMVINQICYKPNASGNGVGWLTDFKMLNRLRTRKTYPMGTTINGKVKPKLKMDAGEVQRWRFIHTGFGDNLGFRIDDRLEVLQIAVDGIMFNNPKSVKSIYLAPGNRVDLLVKASEDAIPGTILPIKSVNYYSKCEYFPGESECQASAPKDAKTVFSVFIGKEQLAMELPTTLPGPGPEHTDIDPDSVTNTRETRFALDWKLKKYFNVNDHAFKMYRIDENPLLGTTEEWTIKADKQKHPYHIHVNPFQVFEFAGREVNPPLWKDVVLVTSDKVVYDNPSKYPSQKGFAKMRTRYQKYHGDFVLHCHILHHEDQGMMQRVRIGRTRADSDLDKPKGNYGVISRDDSDYNPWLIGSRTFTPNPYDNIPCCGC